MNLPNGYLLQGKKYRLTHTIGQGGFGITYQGVWNTEVKGGLGALKTTVPVCIKEYFFKDYCYRDTNNMAVKVHSITGERLFQKFKEKLISEANILSAVHHPNIVNVLEVFQENDTAYIVMEYIKGSSLKHLLDKYGVLPEHKVIKYTHQIGNALTFVHEKNIVHLDIKPGNILIDQDDNARLIDFGVSKRFDIEEQETSTTTLTLSKGFAAIEQYDQEGMLTFSPAPDIYSLGATMYNMLTGVIPVESILRATKRLPPPSAINSVVSQKTEKAILKAMEIKPENRFRKVNELLAAIDAPTYEFTENTTFQPNRVNDDDSTEIINRPVINKPEEEEEEEDKTLLNSNTSQTTKRKHSRRRKARRRVTLTVTIFLCALIGYTVFSYFYDISHSQGTSETISLPGDNSANIQIITPKDSIEADTPAQKDSISNTTENPVRDTLLQTPNNNVRQVTTPSNTGTLNGNASQRKNEADVSKPTYTFQQLSQFKREFDKWMMGGKSKKSAESFQGALEDFTKALELAKKLDLDLTEVNKEIETCKAGIIKQEREERIAKYKTGPKWNELQVVILNGKYGAVDELWEVVIPCIYKDQYPGPGANRTFVRDDGSTDVFDSKGNQIN